MQKALKTKLQPNTPKECGLLFSTFNCKAERNINYACCLVLGTKGCILHLITWP